MRTTYGKLVLKEASKEKEALSDSMIEIALEIKNASREDIKMDQNHYDSLFEEYGELLKAIDEQQAIINTMMHIESMIAIVEVSEDEKKKSKNSNKSSGSQTK